MRGDSDAGAPGKPRGGPRCRLTPPLPERVAAKRTGSIRREPGSSSPGPTQRAPSAVVAVRNPDDQARYRGSHHSDQIRRIVSRATVAERPRSAGLSELRPCRRGAWSSWLDLLFGPRGRYFEDRLRTSYPVRGASGRPSGVLRGARPVSRWPAASALVDASSSCRRDRARPPRAATEMHPRSPSSRIAMRWPTVLARRMEAGSPIQGEASTLLESVLRDLRRVSHHENGRLASPVGSLTPAHSCRTRTLGRIPRSRWWT